MKRKVAIYARVSTEHEAQISALDNQIQYYDNILDIHPDWELVDRYIDEGITGTSVKKRKHFMKMMEDALDGKFSLIITREVSRFARNTVDTLQQTRLLKKHGVEVYFTEDNIWTMNDDDGELKLTLMATLAQNESKKTSTRVKAGQAISFMNGVLYGNGNILGYDRVGKDLVINEEQAKTVKMIFDLYLSGKGVRKIQFELEKRGRLTSTGKSHWDCSCISRILRNPFYCGILEYRKEFVPDYLEQKKITNYGQVEKTVVMGKHQAIITKEEFYKVQSILDSKSSSIVAKGRRGVKPCLDAYCRKLKCECGFSYNRKVWHHLNDGTVQYAYQCYNQINTGTIKTREKKGLSTEGICDVPMVPGWKIRMQADWIFKSFWNNRFQVLDKATQLLEKHIDDDVNADHSDEIKEINDAINKQQGRLKNLIDMRMDGDISKDVFLEKKKVIEDKIGQLQMELSKLSVDVIPDTEDTTIKLKDLRKLMENEFDFSGQEVPEEIIDAFVGKIIVHKDYFEWHLKITEEPLCCKVDGTKRKSDLFLLNETSSFGGGQHRQR